MSEQIKTRKVIGLNGGPRKNWNTASLLEEALKGAASTGAETKLIHLYDLDYKGCRSCFSCKTKENYLKGRCALKDELSSVLELLEDCTGAVMGSPIYLSDVTGALRSFLERYIFINLAYDFDAPSVLKRGPAIGLIYSMNVPETLIETMGYDVLFRSQANFFSRLNPPVFEQLLSCDTYQFSDYSRYHAPMFDEAHKRAVKETQFPQDLKLAYEMGARIGQTGFGDGK
ncbi:MAG: flavodoxin family protein [Deltaproteobacteria bacterium]|jgi:multimeric flavodoxin WrbA|nr:flavodoxin family protein [Deltaproteobacteria bacterium]